MNYLLDALEGEAKRTVKQYEVSNVTYPLVVAHLREKYGNKQALIDQKLCEQRKKPTTCPQEEEANLSKRTMHNGRSCGYHQGIHQLRIVRQIDRKQSSNSQNPIKEGKWERTALPTRGSYSCFYCNKPGHMPKDCKDVGTREKRLGIMSKRRLCHNCESTDHCATQCKRGACRMCNEFGHHTSICRMVSPAQPKHVIQPPRSKTVTKATINKTTTKMNTVTSEQEQEQPKEVKTDMLKDVDSIELTINTFGTPTPLKKVCGVTELQLWDAEGDTHCVTVTRIDTVTEPISRSTLSVEDKRFLSDNDIRLSISPDVREVRPSSS
ncbi:zinc knuckle [Necator americanus]|uniref:Zinc knuckle n=1 Tax=Necator americanus TaxID=51031 RepID=W2SLT3_NECAM|nr:zinc knuckle [Necator americanus]ETN70503.1 zinc knuckle [Necator americanus]